ncbi:MAG: hypothetical protein V2G52_02105 [bacterium JZ-2024 1]
MINFYTVGKEMSTKEILPGGKARRRVTGKSPAVGNSKILNTLKKIQ